MKGLRAVAARTAGAGDSLTLEVARMFIVMAIQAQQLPVTAIGRIVVVIMVAVMNSQFLQVATGKLA